MGGQSRPPLTMRDMSRTKRDVGDAVPYCFRSSFSSMRVNSSGRGQWSSTGSPVRGWRKRRPVAWRH